MERARVVWPDGTNSTERYQDLILVQRSGSDHPEFLGIMEGPLIHDEDIGPEYRQILVDQGLSGKSKHAEGTLNPSGQGGPTLQVPKTRDYLGNQVNKHPVGDNKLSEYSLKELQYGGVQRGFQPFNGFERFADYLWR